MRDAEAYVSSKWVRAMCARGHRVEVFAASPNRESPNYLKTVTDSFTRQWPWTFTTFELRDRRKLDQYVSEALPAFMAQHRHQAFDVIVSRYEPVGSVAAAYWAHKRTGLPWLASINDPMPSHTALRRGLRGVVDKQRNQFQELWARRTLESAESFVFPSERLRDTVVTYATRLGINSQNLLQHSNIIPHIGGPIVSGDNSKQVIGSDSNGKLVIRHIGFLTPSRDPTTLLKALEQLDADSSSSSLAFEFVGTIDKHQQLIDSYRVRLKRVEIRTRAEVDTEDAFALMQTSAVCVVIERPGPESPFLPSKFCDYAAAGRPILAITSPQGAVAQYLNAFGGGITIEHGNPVLVAEALRTLLGQPDSHSSLLQRQFRPEEIARKWEGIDVMRGPAGESLRSSTPESSLALPS